MNNLKARFKGYVEAIDDNHCSDEEIYSKATTLLDVANAYILSEIYKGKQPPIIPKVLLWLICDYWILSPNEALYQSCSTRMIGSVYWALEKGASANALSYELNDISQHMRNIFLNVLTGSFTPLHFCVSKGYYEIAKTLLEHNNDMVHTLTSYRESYLHIAANNNDVDMCELLLFYGCKLNSGDKLGRTPLMDAVDSKSEKIVDFLIENNADVNREDKEHYTAISYCLDNCNEPAYFKIALNLLNHGAHPGYGGKYTDRTLLHYAAARGDLELVEQITEFSNYIVARDIDGKTALDYAKEFKRQHVIDYLEMIIAANTGCGCIIL